MPVLACGLATVFFAPYLFPHEDPGSASHAVHFSNRAAQIILVLVATGFALWTRGLGLVPPPETAAGSAPPRRTWPALYLVQALTVASVGLIWLWQRNLGAFDEIIYFLDRYAAHERGRQLYTQMEFSYGPLLFYPQVWAAHALGWSFGDAHCLVVLLEWVAGMLLLWYVTMRVGGTRRQAVVLFVLLSGLWLTAAIDMGVNYTPMRFVLAPACALALHGAWRRGRGPALIFGAAAAAFWFLLFLSPEQGIGFAAATVLFFAVCVRDRRLAAPLAGFAVACAAGLLVAFRVGVLSTLLAIGGGAMDLPVLPTLPVVLLLAELVLAACVAVAAWQGGRRQGRELYLIALSLASLPAALGRCDSGHIFINTLPALAVVFAAIAWHRRGVLLAAAPLVYLLVVTLYAVEWHHGIDILQRQLRSSASAGQPARLRLRAAITRVASLLPARVRQNVALRMLPLPPPPAPQAQPAMPLIAPFGYLTSFQMVHPAPVDPGYYAGYYALFNAHAPQQQSDELMQHPGVALALPASFRTRCPDDNEGMQDSLDHTIFGAWYIPRVRATGLGARPFCAYIAAHYRPTGTYAGESGLEVWIPKSDPGAIVPHP